MDSERGEWLGINQFANFVQHIISLTWPVLGGKPGKEALHPLHGDFDLLERSGEATAQIAFTAGPKGAARYAGDFLLLQEFYRKVL